MNSADRHAGFREQDLPLRDDVSSLGALVGDVIREQGGEALFEQVERSRQAAIRRREAAEGPSGEGQSEEHAEASRGLQALVDDLAPSRAELLVRSFLAYFQVVNLAEQIHRIRRRRVYLRQGVAQKHSLLDVMRQLKADGLSLGDVRGLLARFWRRSCASPRCWCAGSIRR